MGIDLLDRALSLLRARLVPRRAWADNGAVLVEASIVAIVLAILVFGMINFGLLMHQANSDADSIRSGSRVAGMTGQNADADYAILQAMKTKDTGIGGGVTNIVIYKADSENGAPEGKCAKFIAVKDSCNVYSASDVDNLSAVLAKSSNWNPAIRAPGTDYIGIRVQSDFAYMTAFFGKNKIFNDTSVIQLQTAPAATGGSTEFTNGSDIMPPSGKIDGNGDTNGGGGGSNGGGGPT